MKLSLLCCLLPVSLLSFAQSKDDKELVKQIDKLIGEQYQQYAPGCQVLVAKKGQVLYHKGVGSANLELNVPMTTGMVLRIGSITKQFTAVTLLQLVDKGLVSLTDSIQQYLKNFHFKGYTIRVEHLLTHTSGIIGYEQINVRMPNVTRVDFSQATVLDSLDKHALLFAPGTKFNYSNSNYFLAGMIIEAITGKSYASYLKENIFQPAGLTATYYESATELIPNRTNGYSFYDNRYWNPDYMSMSLVYSAGALLSNTNDLFRWHQALYSGKIIKKETLQKAITPYTLADGTKIDYGYGFFVREEQGMLSVGHGGAIDGFRATEMYYPQQDIYIACLLNSSKDDEARLFQSIASLVVGTGTGQNLNALNLSEEQLQLYAGTYTNEQYKLTIKVYVENGRIYGDLSNGTGTHLIFIPTTTTHFILPDIKRIKTTATFIVDKGNTSALEITQDKPIRFLKIQ
ncbi:serine hydrolase [Flavihumibacter sp. CACIAM 22H1]|uniref:serine hydrolase n=1 Tax=Flavihumibacter sp. CACIAM 22H1 TaxID=1812911 RepID=UPI0025BB7D73|nr:serine hydrolase [Flavihumibacter sp. CACIAM 22H1]